MLSGFLNCVQRFFPSEFGNDVDRVDAVEPAKSAFATKAEIRRAIEGEGIPYTYVSANYFAGYFLPTLVQLGATSPPRDKVIILGDGTVKGIVFIHLTCLLNHGSSAVPLGVRTRIRRQRAHHIG